MALTTLVPTPLLAGLSFFLLGAGPILWVICDHDAAAVGDAAVAARPRLGDQHHEPTAPARSAPRSAPSSAALYGAEACLYLAAAIFAAQALVIWMSPAVSLARQPDMVGEPAC